MKTQLLSILAGAALLFAPNSHATAGTVAKSKTPAHKSTPSILAKSIAKRSQAVSVHKATATLPSALFSRAITARASITLNGAFVVDAYNSVLGPYDPVTNRTAAGDVATSSSGKGAITVNAATVCGTAATAPGGTIVIHSGAIGDLAWCATQTGIEPGWSNDNVNITWTTNLPPSGVPTIPATVTSVSGSNITWLAADSSVAIYKVSSFTTRNSAEPLVVNGHCTLYVTGDFTIEGSGYVEILPGASLTLYVGNRTAISGSGVVNDGGNPSDFTYIGLESNQTVAYSGHTAFYGTINAPQADVKMTGSDGTYGAIICNTYTGSGAANLHYDTSLATPDNGPFEGLDMLVDSDGDGLTNLVEYAVGSNPFNSSDGNDGLIIFITQDGANHYLAMQYKRRTDAADLALQYLPEVSADKLTWYSDNAHVLALSVTPLNNSFDWVTVRDTTPITAAAARFIRLHVLLGPIESFSPVWIGSDTVIHANNLTLFSQRMVRPILSAGVVATLSANSLTVTNSLTNNEFGTNGLPAYVEFDNGAMIDIANTSAKTVALAGNAAGFSPVGSPYRIRGHFTVATLFGTNNEAGLVAGPNPAKADNIMLMIPETQNTLTIFWYSNPSFTTWQGWVRADTFTPAADEVVYPEEGVMVGRIAPTDANLYLCGPVKTGVALAPILPGYNLLGTLKSLSGVTLSALNLYTGDPATGVASGLNPSQGDNLLVVNPDGSVTTYFYYFKANLYSGWVDANGFTLAGNTLIPPGSAFFLNRQAPGAFNWTIPAE